MHAEVASLNNSSGSSDDAVPLSGASAAGWQAALVPVAVVVALVSAGHGALWISAKLIGNQLIHDITTYGTAVAPLVVLALYYVYRHGRAGLFEAMALRLPTDPDGSAARLLLVCGAVIAVIGLLMASMVVAAFSSPQPFVSALPPDYRQVLPRLVTSWWLLAPLIVLVAPIVEEIVFRGYLQGQLSRIFGESRLPVLISGALFAALHMPGTGAKAVGLLVMGTVLALVRARTGSVWPGMAVHAIWNAMVLAVLFGLAVASQG